MKLAQLQEKKKKKNHPKNNHLNWLRGGIKLKYETKQSTNFPENITLKMMKHKNGPSIKKSLNNI